jgi:hypothetical protein
MDMTFLWSEGCAEDWLTAARGGRWRRYTRLLVYCLANTECSPVEYVAGSKLAVEVDLTVLHRHRGGRTGNINAWYLNTHMVYL